MIDPTQTPDPRWLTGIHFMSGATIAVQAFLGSCTNGLHALQRTAPRVTAAAPPASPAQPPRHAPASLSLKPLGAATRIP